MTSQYTLAKLSMQIESDEKAAYYTTELLIAGQPSAVASDTEQAPPTPVVDDTNPSE